MYTRKTCHLQYFRHASHFVCIASHFIPVDDIAPITSCLEDITSTISLNLGGTVVSWDVEPSATDNSGIVTLASRSHAPGSFFTTGLTQVVYVFRDASGNSAECRFTVTVTEGT